MDILYYGANAGNSSRNDVLHRQFLAFQPLPLSGLKVHTCFY